MTSIKTATVNVRIQENVKIEAEAILKKLGLTNLMIDKILELKNDLK